MNSTKKIFSVFLVILFLSTNVSGQQFKALLVTTTRGWHHSSVHDGVLAMKELAKKNSFDLMLMEDPNYFTDKNLAPFQVIIFLNTTGDILDSAGQGAMERFIRSGKGFVGIHSATDTEYDWDWYTKMVGRMFMIHPAVQTAKLKVLDPSFPGLKPFEGGRLWTDEWYQFGPEKSNDLHYVMAVDEKTYNPKADWGSKKGEGMGDMHPVAWYHDYDGGRAFYTALGHLPAIYSDADFLNHVYAGILWAATGKK